MLLLLLMMMLMKLPTCDIILIFVAFSAWRSASRDDADAF